MSMLFVVPPGICPVSPKGGTPREDGDGKEASAAEGSFDFTFIPSV